MGIKDNFLFNKTFNSEFSKLKKKKQHHINRSNKTFGF